MSMQNDDITVLQAQVQKLTEVAARAQADLQNFKDRMKKEAQELRTFAAAPALLAIVPLRDDLARAAEHEEGAATILAKLEKTLEHLGVKRIKALGKKVDPHKHEVVNTAPGEEGVISAVHEEGYEYHGRVLRPAKVQVGSSTSEGTTAVSPQQEVE